MSGDKKPKQVAVRVRERAHVDEAFLQAGYVSKVEPLIVAANVARELVAAHHYLVMED